LGFGLKAIGFVWTFATIQLFFSTDLIVETQFPFSVVLLLALFAPGIAALALGCRMCVRTFEPGAHPDSRAPVLFLRAFDDDGRKSFEPTGALARLHGNFRYENIFRFRIWPAWIAHPIKLIKSSITLNTCSAEDVLVSGFRRLGPLIAIGRPREGLPTSGADRMYVPDAVWQEIVLDYLA